MSILEQPGWACVALATPVVERPDGALSVDIPRLVDRARYVLAAGCNGVVPFGTTGEGPAFSVQQRCLAVEGLLAAGIGADRIIVGCGATALADVIALARHACGVGCAVLAPPPFFLRAGGADGIFDAYRRVVAGVGSSALRLLIYNIPSVSGFPVPVATVQALARAHPGIVVGVKDSGLVWDEVAPMVRGGDGLRIAVGLESFIPRAMALGGVGTICGLGNIVPQTVAATVAGNAAAGEALARLAAAFDGRPFLPTLKAVMAALSDEAEWAQPMPPLDPVAAAAVDDIVGLVRGMAA
ncbi:MAG: dihydrodipicolinate synthase family protein [Alphaproteobacteria bacterium]